MGEADIIYNAIQTNLGFVGEFSYLSLIFGLGTTILLSFVISTNKKKMWSNLLPCALISKAIGFYIPNSLIILLVFVFVYSNLLKQIIVERFVGKKIKKSDEDKGIKILKFIK